jgi:hypothetical protein
MLAVDGEDLADDTFLSVGPAVVAAAVAEPGRWALWWPDLTVTVTRNRGMQGLQWQVGGGLDGTAEVWLEPWRDGTILHFYLRAGLDDAARARRDRSWKASVHALKDELEAGRAPGQPTGTTGGGSRS